MSQYRNLDGTTLESRNFESISMEVDGELLVKPSTANHITLCRSHGNLEHLSTVHESYPHEHQNLTTLDAHFFFFNSNGRYEKIVNSNLTEK